MHIDYNDETLVSSVLKEKINDAVEACIKEEGLSKEKLEVSISFVDDKEIQQLNAQYRNKDTVTDVLSFPQFEAIEEIDWNMSLICLGDVVISLDKAADQASEYGHSIEREIVYLVVHSILHLLGYDHMNERDKEMMRIKEEKVMKKVQLERLNRS